MNCMYCCCKCKIYAKRSQNDQQQLGRVFSCVFLCCCADVQTRSALSLNLMAVVFFGVQYAFFGVCYCCCVPLLKKTQKKHVLFCCLVFFWSLALSLSLPPSLLSPFTIGVPFAVPMRTAVTFGALAAVKKHAPPQYCRSQNENNKHSTCEGREGGGRK